MRGAIKAGPKAPISVGPLDLSSLPSGGGDRAVAFIESHLCIPKGTGARQPVRLRPWQAEIVHALYGDPRPRSGLLSIPRGNGKTSLAAMLALYALYADGEEGAQVLAVASDERQAGILFSTARRMVELSEELSSRTHIYKDRLVVPETSSELRPLPSEEAALLGFDPSLAVVDELAVVSVEVWEAMLLAAGKRERSLVLAISTPAGDRSGVMWQLRDHGINGHDPSFYFREYAAPAGCEVGDETAWAIANPALDDFLHRDAMRSTLKVARESAFRRYRLGQWVSTETTWLPDGAWAACADPDRVIPDGIEVVLGFDGSYNGDSTAIVAVSCTEVPHAQVVKVWERPQDADERLWRVPILEVEDELRAACRRWSVREIVADPYRWARSLEILEGEGLPVIAFPQSPQRMTPATQRLYQAIINGTLTHSGDERLSAHLAHAHVRDDARGYRLTKDPRNPRKRIDLAVALVMAFDRAMQPRDPVVPVTIY